MIYPIVITCLEPLHHGFFGPRQGNAATIRRMPVVSIPGMPRIPCVSGNAIRGVLRRIVMRELLHRADLMPGQPGHGRLPSPGAWDRLYAALAGGGTLAGSEGAEKTDLMRQIRSSLPPLSVLGSALYTYMLPGHLRCHIAWLRCRENGHADRLPANDQVEDIGYCRHVERDFADPAISGVTPMPTEIEVLCRGAVLDGAVSFVAHATEVERGVVAHGLHAIEYLGGKSGTGHGHVQIEHELDGTPYVAWLAATQDLQDRLIWLAEQLAKTPKKKEAARQPRRVD